MSAPADGLPELEWGYDLGCCGGVVRLRAASPLVAEEGLGDTSWTHQYLGTCPFCEKRHPWMRRLSESP